VFISSLPTIAFMLPAIHITTDYAVAFDTTFLVFNVLLWLSHIVTYLSITSIPYSFRLVKCYFI